jgi:hypothetical protein
MIGKANLELTTHAPNPPSKSSIVQTFGPQPEKITPVFIRINPDKTDFFVL